MHVFQSMPAGVWFETRADPSCHPSGPNVRPDPQHTPLPNSSIRYGLFRENEHQAGDDDDNDDDGEGVPQEPAGSSGGGNVHAASPSK
jgi:hypothetical protein